MVAAYDYTWDTLGNLTYRSDDYNGVFEYACYDSQNRLTNYASGTGVSSCTSSGAKSATYDAIGNITYKSDTGYYGYLVTGSRPHALASVTGTVNGTVNPSYSYDANGNMTSGAGRSVSYTAFNMAATITQGSATVSLSYDADHVRVKMVASSGTTYYLNDPASGAMSEKQVSGSTVTWHDYVQADGKMVAVKFSGGMAAVRYFTTDHLGSVSVVTDESGTVVERDAYDAWGKRRVAATGADDTACSLTSLTTRGFTGHEQLDSVCLINANARIYDAALGKFLSPDSMIPDPYDSQSYNRYTYVRNRPLSATDPTGHTDVINEIVPGDGYRDSPSITGLFAQYFLSDMAVASAGASLALNGVLTASGYGPTPTAAQVAGSVIAVRAGHAASGGWLYKVTWTINNSDGTTSEASMIVAGDVDAGGYAHVLPLGNPDFGGGEIGSQDSSTGDTNGGLQDAVFRGGNSAQVTRFFNLSYRQLSAEAKKRKVPETWMVGLGAFESGYLDDHNVRLNNPLGHTEAGGNNIRFRSIDSAVDLFDSLYGEQIEGARSPQDFARRLEGVLNGVKMDGWNKYNSVNPVWEQRLIGVINSVGAHLDAWKIEFLREL